MNRRHLTLVTLILIAGPARIAMADPVYPPGTGCANLPTIAARLICGRQELKRGDAAAREPNVPPPPYDGYSPDPDAAQPPPGSYTAEPNPDLPTINDLQTAPSQP